MPDIDTLRHVSLLDGEAVSMTMEQVFSALTTILRLDKSSKTGYNKNNRKLRKTCDALTEGG